MNSNNFVYANIEMCTSYSNTLKSFTYLERELLYKFDENHFVRLSDIKNKFSLLKYYLYIKANKELKKVCWNYILTKGKQKTAFPKQAAVLLFNWWR